MYQNYRQKNNGFKKIFYLFLVVIIFLWVVNSYWNNLLSPIDKNSNKKSTLEITEGQGIAQISQALVAKNLIRSALPFEILAKIEGKSSLIQQGEFDLSQSMSAQSILEIITHDEAGKEVTLLEGWRDEEMAVKLHQVLGISITDFLQKSKQGYMFPDTYQFGSQVTVNEVVNTLELNFNKKYTPALKKKIEKLGLTPYQGVILASIVEREARSDSARQMVASILLKRIKIGMPLDTDATVQYALGYQKDTKSWWKKRLTLNDLKVDSLYNTYLHSGLPPTPICNPSLSSLKAVGDATNTPYLYYYHDSFGVPHYATTLDQQNQNIANFP